MKLLLMTTGVDGNIADALRSICSFDKDFNGENGLDYLWSDVDPDKYNSNMEYLLNTLHGTEEEIADRFINEWMQYGRCYYMKYNYSIHACNGKVSYISLAVVY